MFTFNKGRPDFIGGIDNEALDFGQLESFIHVTNSVAVSGNPQTISTGEALPHLPESPPDSGSEPPYSPADLHCLGRTGAPIDANIGVGEIINNEPQLITKINEVVSVNQSKNVDKDLQADLPDMTGCIQHTATVPPIEQNDGAIEVRTNTHQIVPKPNVLYLRNEEEPTSQSSVITNTLSNSILLKTNELICGLTNGTTTGSVDSQNRLLQKQVYTF